MGQPVLFLYMAKGKDAWWELSDDEKESFAEKIRASFKAVGGENIVNAQCEWSNPNYVMFGVQEFPSIEALQQHFKDERELGMWKYVDSAYIVGTRSAPDD